ncbi:MAG: flavin reductase family protein [Thalassobaculaceae bacterium]|nr:flavin reductase family protein [Thalassobaculaceae bacterium]
MFYEPEGGHGLPHDPFKAIVAPRPIGWISTVDTTGRHNLAPYSFFSAIATTPPMVSFTSEGLKDSAVNARDTGEFVCNLSTLALAQEMNASARETPPDVDEFEMAGIETAPCRLVAPLRVAASPAVLECKVTDFIHLKNLSGNELNRYMVLGEVVGVHIDEAYLKDGLFDTAAAQSLARCGYMDYAAVMDVFSIRRPDAAE